MTTTGSWTLRKQELFRAVKYTPHAGQVLVHRSRASRRILACGVRFGKSLCAAHEAVAALLEPRERSIGWCVAPTYELADRVFGLVLQIVETHLKHRIRTVSAHEQRIVLRNLAGGLSEVRGKSADRPASLLGEGLDWVIIDEAAVLTRQVWESYLSQRLLDRKGWALMTSTPRGSGWFQSMFRRGQNGRDPAFESWSLPSSANPFLDAAAIEAERTRLPEETFNQEYLGKFVGMEAEPCDTCGGPGASDVGILYLRVDQEIQRCQDCERPITEDGRSAISLWYDKEPHLEIVRIKPPDFALCMPDELIPPEMLEADRKASYGPGSLIKWGLEPEEIELAKQGVPMAEWEEHFKRCAAAATT